MTTLRLTTDPDRVATLTLDAPDKPVNTCSPAFFADFAAALDRLEAEKPAALIIASAKPKNFCAGADLVEVRAMSPEQVREYIALGQRLFDRLAALPFPTIAAINGDCLGGGYEMALACRYRVAGEGRAGIGLPETKLGLIPAWGGTTRLPRLLGLARALPVLLAGKTMPPKKAAKVGLVDEVVRPEALLAAAKRVVTGGRPAGAPGKLDRTLAAVGFLRRRALAKARERTLATTHGNYPAPMKLIDVVAAGYDKGTGAGFEAERTAIVELMASDACRNLLRIFFLKTGAKKRAASQARAKPREVKHAAVIGGGTMGAGIAHALISAGIPTRLIEVDDKAVSAALGRVARMLEEDVIAGRSDRLAARHTLNRLAPSTDWTGLELADLVVEAVLETKDVKRPVFEKLDRLCRTDAVLATNTSSLVVEELARGTAHPGRVIGLHFFNPVPKMPLVEVVRTPLSDDGALATAIGLAGRIGKTPVLVSDAPGFLVNRVLIPYLAEAVVMAAEGAPIPRVDIAMKRWGMPMGPFELLDEIGLDVAVHVFEALGGRFVENPAALKALRSAVERGWLGKKSGTGFYLHAGGKTKAADLALNEGLADQVAGGARPPESAAAAPDEGQLAAEREAVQWRLVLPMVNEAARLLIEGVVDSVDDIDLATVFGTGLAPFRGGLARFARGVGVGELTRRLRDLEAAHGPRFAPAPGLSRLTAPSELDTTAGPTAGASAARAVPAEDPAHRAEAPPPGVGLGLPGEGASPDAARWPRPAGAEHAAANGNGKTGMAPPSPSQPTNPAR